MGIKKLFKQQLRSVIEWKEQDTNILFHRLDTSTDEIKNSSKLIVAPGQGCLLVYDGKVKATLTEPDTYELQTDNTHLLQHFLIWHKEWKANIKCASISSVLPN